MIDWTSFLLGLLFAGTGTLILCSSLGRAGMFYFMNFFVGIFFITLAIFLIPQIEVSFNPELHQCTKWERNEMPEEGWDLVVEGYYDYEVANEFLENNPNGFCSLWKVNSDKPTASVFDVLRCERMNAYNCVSWSEKT